MALIPFQFDLLQEVNNELIIDSYWAQTEVLFGFYVPQLHRQTLEFFLN